jgi:phosphoglycerol geranylgeranyltransferase
MDKVYQSIVNNAHSGKKQLAVLIDPDKSLSRGLESTAKLAADCKVDLFFVGGSLLTSNRLENCIEVLKKNCHIPVVLFPGNTMQISRNADAILFLSLISGRNPEMLIGKHVIAAPYIKEAGLEVIPTGYMLIESGKPTAALYMSNSSPIPSDKDDIALCTAMAGEMLGLKMIYMDAGSGALHPVEAGMIKKVKENLSVPLIIGGGIRTREKARQICDAGADMIVVGNAIESDISLIAGLAEEMGKK